MEVEPRLSLDELKRLEHGEKDAGHPDKRLRVDWQDESRFGQPGTTTNVWAKPGSRPTAIRQTEYEHLGGARDRLSGDGSRRRAAEERSSTRRSWASSSPNSPSRCRPTNTP